MSESQNKPFKSVSAKCTERCGGKMRLCTMRKAGKYYWVRCNTCGAHTSSYLLSKDAVEAASLGEFYVSENGNKVFDSISQNKALSVARQ